MAKRQQPVQSGYVDNLPDAERVAKARVALARTLLRLSPEVRGVYDEWLEKMQMRSDLSHDAFNAACVEDARSLTALVASVNLDRFAWLPSLLYFEFLRSFEESHSGQPLHLELTLPAWASDRAKWATSGRRPKDGPKQHEDIERNVEWFFCVKVKRPPDTVYALGKEYSAAEGTSNKSQVSTIEAGIIRAESLLSALTDLPE